MQKVPTVVGLSSHICTHICFSMLVIQDRSQIKFILIPSYWLNNQGSTQNCNALVKDRIIKRIYYSLLPLTKLTFIIFREVSLTHSGMTLKGSEHRY